jgi:hypothetical protein
MKLDRLVANEDANRVKWGAAAAAFLGLGTLVIGILALTLDRNPAGSVIAAFGVIQLALAYGVHRRSRACAIAVLAIFALERLLTFLSMGIGTSGIVWTVIIAVTLVNGLKGILSERERAARTAAPR